jgi:penicillin-binding protein-related factor A (putative recombinase)
MEEEFYSTIKLTTGEEIVAKVCYLANEKQLLIENPKKVEPIKHRRNGETVEGFVLVDWIHSTYDQMYIISMDRIITMSELDKRIERYYLATIDGSELTEDQGKIPASKLNQKMGYLGSVNEMKKTLEKIYKIS